MTGTSVRKDPEALTMTVEVELDVPVERAWQLWADPRQLERWWGPPTWPATFEQHDVVIGGRSSYYMTGPEGEKARGWWRFVALDEPRRLEFEDGFSDESGAPDASMPTIQVRVDLEEAGPGTRMTITSRFDTADQMEQVVQMGMVEGMTAAMGQIDGLLAAG
jgi:uncharacterized protein YndB with AHSA1/START domain